MRLTQSADAVSEANAGGKYRLYDGTIAGEYKELVANEKITMLWRMKDWKDGDHSYVEITFSDLGDSNCSLSVN